jgi:hypothetical protein
MLRREGCWKGSVAAKRRVEEVNLWYFFLWPDCNQVFVCSGFTFQFRRTAVAC